MDLPDDVVKLKSIINGKDTTIAELENRVILLMEQVTILEKYRFARSSEQWTDEDRLQQSIFDEAELGAGLAPSDDAEYETEQISYQRKKPKGRKPIADDVPRTVIVHELSEEERRCGIDGCARSGDCEKLRPVIGEQTREELEFIPAQIIVKHHVYRSYGAIDCETLNEDVDVPAVINTPREKRIIPRGIVTASLLSFIVVSKFADGLPLYRLERILSRLGIHIRRQTMSRWVIAAAMACEMYLELLRSKIREGPLINMDETPLQVLHEPGRKPDTKSYMWVMVGSVDDRRKLVLYHYSQTRSGEVAKRLLSEYEGVLQSDAYKGYRGAVTFEGIYNSGAWLMSDESFTRPTSGLESEAMRIEGSNSSGRCIDTSISCAEEISAMRSS